MSASGPQLLGSGADLCGLETDLWVPGADLLAAKNSGATAEHKVSLVCSGFLRAGTDKALLVAVALAEV